MSAYAQAMAVLRGVICPHCLRAELSTILHLDDGIKGDSRCVCAVHCEHCGENFTIEFAGIEPLVEIQRQVEAGLRETKCAACGQANYALSLVCK